MFPNQKNKWNLDVKSNLENFEFWLVLISKCALVTTTLQICTSTLRLQYKFRVVRDTNEIFIPLTVVQGTANIAQKYQQPL